MLFSQIQSGFGDKCRQVFSDACTMPMISWRTQLQYGTRFAALSLPDANLMVAYEAEVL